MIRRSGKKKSRGAAAVEAAIVLSVFVMAFLGIIEFGRGMTVAQLLQHSAREGARRAALQNSTNASVTAHIEDFLSRAVPMDANDVTVDITIEADPENDTTGHEIANCERRDLINIQVSANYSNVSLMPAQWMEGRVISGHCSMRKE